MAADNSLYMYDPGTPLGGGPPLSAGVSDSMASTASYDDDEAANVPSAAKRRAVAEDGTDHRFAAGGAAPSDSKTGEDAHAHGGSVEFRRKPAHDHDDSASVTSTVTQSSAGSAPSRASSAAATTGATTTGGGGGGATKPKKNPGGRPKKMCPNPLHQGPKGCVDGDHCRCPGFGACTHGPGECTDTHNVRFRTFCNPCLAAKRKANKEKKAAEKRAAAAGGGTAAPQQANGGGAAKAPKVAGGGSPMITGMPTGAVAMGMGIGSTDVAMVQSGAGNGAVAAAPIIMRGVAPGSGSPASEGTAVAGGGYDIKYAQAAAAVAAAAAARAPSAPGPPAAAHVPGPGDSPLETEIPFGSELGMDELEGLGMVFDDLQGIEELDGEELAGVFNEMGGGGGGGVATPGAPATAPAIAPATSTDSQMRTVVHVDGIAHVDGLEREIDELSAPYIMWKEQPPAGPAAAAAEADGGTKSDDSTSPTLDVPEAKATKSAPAPVPAGMRAKVPTQARSSSSGDTPESRASSSSSSARDMSVAIPVAAPVAPPRRTSAAEEAVADDRAVSAGSPLISSPRVGASKPRPPPRTSTPMSPVVDYGSRDDLPVATAVPIAGKGGGGSASGSDDDDSNGSGGADGSGEGHVLHDGKGKGKDMDAHLRMTSVDSFVDAHDGPKSVGVAYVLWTVGFLGAPHFYLGRPKIGCLYACSLGLLGIGWLVDLCRLPTLVKRYNLSAGNGVIADYNKDRRHLDDAYVLAVPLGFLGLHHFYLGRTKWGIAYLCTLGFLGVGWVIDLFRMRRLVDRANRDADLKRAGMPLESDTAVHLDDAYVLAFPLGFLGLHHFYLGRMKWGILYLCTLGLLGVGWLFDLFRMRTLVTRAGGGGIMFGSSAAGDAGGPMPRAQRTDSVGSGYVTAPGGMSYA